MIFKKTDTMLLICKQLSLELWKTVKSELVFSTKKKDQHTKSLKKKLSDIPLVDQPLGVDEKLANEFKRSVYQALA